MEYNADLTSPAVSQPEIKPKHPSCQVKSLPTQSSGPKGNNSENHPCPLEETSSVCLKPTERSPGERTAARPPELRACSLTIPQTSNGKFHTSKRNDIKQLKFDPRGSSLKLAYLHNFRKS
ncbi:hypothetical protein RRG08_056609 [Elysia crispata]|uniref:Uncharacterized protein n=1 Tax=Elysia crispata TaxID=231223 RepID=A0AAE1EAG8_9GAST|nr:hypothetical protein RRG08_056609 [Elysia crispata]